MTGYSSVFRPLFVFLLALASVMAAASPRALQAQGVAYSIVPSGEELRWEDAWGFDRSRFLGVRVGLDFGPLVSLQPFYARDTEVTVRDGVTDSSESGEWTVDAYGADIQFNLLTGRLVPFVRAGGGVLRLDDGGGERDERILLRAGGGLRLGLGERVSAELYAENWANRLEAPYLAGAADAEDLPDDGFVRSLVVGAGLRIPFGGDARGWSPGGGAFLPGIYLEPFAGRLDFNDELGLERQALAGARAGLDINRNVGLRAFYWRGVDDDFSETQPLEGYGGEAQFTFNTGPGISPFLVAGAGRIDFEDDYLDLAGETRASENHLILGGGLALGLSDRARLEVGARNFLFGASEELEDLTMPDQLRSSWLYSAGLSVSFGADARDRELEAREREIAALRDRQGERSGADDERLARLDRELQELRDQNRELREALERGGDGVTLPPRVTGVDDDTGLRQMVDPATGQRLLLVPVPEVGEIILRYGEAYAVQAEPGTTGVGAAELARLERLVAEALREEGVELPQALNEARLAELEARIPEIVRRVVREELDRMGVRPGAAAPPAAARPDAPTPPPALAPELEAGGVAAEPRRVRRVEPHLGVQVSSPSQFLVGSRVNLGPLSPSVPLDLVPELTFGIGEGDPSLFLGVHARYTLRSLTSSRNVAPYVLGGVALTNRDFLRLNLGYGVEFDFGDRTGGNDPYRMFIEHLGVGLFDEHRFLVGVGLPLGGGGGGM